MKKLLSSLAILFLLAPITAHGFAVTEENPFKYDQNAEMVLEGNTKIYGYIKLGDIVEDLVKDEKQYLQQKIFFNITQYEHESLTPILQDLYDNGNQHVKKENDQFQIQIGCYENFAGAEKISSPQQTLSKGETEYTLLMTSSESVITSFDIEFALANWMYGTDCLSLADQWTFEYDNTFPYGDHEVEGYYIKQESELFGNTYKEGYLVITKYLGFPEFKEYIKKTIEAGNTLNGVAADGNYKFNLGCYDNESVGTYRFKIESDQFTTLKNSTKANPVKAVITMSTLLGIGGGCLSLAHNVAIPEVTLGVVGTFPDVLTNHPNSEAIEMLYKSNIIDGHPDGTFQPDVSINRAELTKLVVEMMIGDPLSQENVGYNCFPDVKEEWFAPHVCYAQEKGWVEGYPNGDFKPEGTTNRAEALKIILNAFYSGELPLLNVSESDSAHMPTDSYSDQWYYSFLKYSVAKDLLDRHHVIHKFDNSYAYQTEGEISRKEVAETIYRLMNL